MARPGEKTKEIIFQKALSLIQENGYDNVTLAHICKAAGIAKNTFYYYFDSKDEILIEFYRRSSTLSVERMAYIMSIENHYEQLWHIDRAYIAFLECAGSRLIRQLFAVSLSGEKARFEMEHLGDEITKLELGLIQKAQQASQIRNPSRPEDLLMAKNEMIYGAIMRWCTMQQEGDILQEIKHCYDILFLPVQKG